MFLLRRIGVALLLAAWSGGCASVQVSHAKAVASAGTAWATAMDGLLRLVEETSIDADSARVLSEGRKLTRDERRQVLGKHAAISATVADLERLRKHARALGRYFQALHALTETDADKSAEAAAARAAGAASELGKELAGSPLLTASERDLIGRAAGAVVGGVREQALRRELEARGAVIARELDIEYAVLVAVRRQVRADAASVRELGLARDVTEPYLEGTVTDAHEWISRRREHTLPEAAAEALGDASETASRLKTAWGALTQGRLDDAAWSAILADAESLVTWVRDIERARP
ncbi:MAG: hypothetical protein ABI592_12525 [Acidobacteriota bacterium]